MRPAAPLAAGVGKLARAVRSTLGPRGRNAVLDKGWGSPKVTKDGVTVAEDIELDDPYENLGAQLVKEAASKTNDVAGDGTTTATVLAEGIFREGLQDDRRRRRSDGARPRHPEGRRGGQRSDRQAGRDGRRQGQEGDLQQIATIAGNNDPTIGNVLADAFTKVGKDGVITVEEGRGSETTVEVVEGMQFDRGFLSPHFVTNQDEQDSRARKLPDPRLRREDLQRQERWCRCSKRSAKAGKPLLIIAEDVEGEALATLVVNKLRGILQVCAVKAPGYGDRRKAMLGDIADAHRRHRDLQGPRHQARRRQALRPRQGQEGDRHRTTTRRSSAAAARRKRSTAGPSRFAARSKTPTATTIARSCKSGWPSWPAAWRRSRSAPRPKRK